MKLIVLALSFFISQNLRAESYLPYVYKSASLVERKKQKKLFEREAIDIAGEGQLSSVELDGVELNFYREIFEILEDMSGQTQSWIQNPLKPEPNLCAAHQSLDIGLIKNDIESGLCRDSVATLIQQFGLAQKKCQRLADPATYIQTEFEKRYPQFVPLLGQFHKHAINPEDFKIKEVKDLIVVVGAQLLTAKFPEKIAHPNFKIQAAKILKKLLYEEFSKSIDELRIQEQQMEKRLSDCGSVQSVNLIKKMQGDLEEFKKYLDQLNSEGKAQAQRQAEAVSERGLCRNKLPYPNLTDEDREFLSIYLGGLYWRLRGGGVWSRKKGSQSGRYYNLVPLQILGDLVAGPEGSQIGKGIHHRIGLGYSRHMDHGFSNDDKWIDLMNMTRRGYFQVGYRESEIVPWLKYKVLYDIKSSGISEALNLKYSPSWLIAGGAHMGLCYYYSYERFFKKLIVGKELLLAPTGGTDWAEICFGSSLSLGMAKTLLYGRSCQ